MQSLEEFKLKLCIPIKKKKKKKKFNQKNFVHENDCPKKKKKAFD